MNTIAQTIVAQIGNRTFTMLGAHSMSFDLSSVAFQFRGSHKANRVKVELKSSDTYTVTFYKGKYAQLVCTCEDVMVGELHSVIEHVTGLYTSF